MTNLGKLFTFIVLILSVTFLVLAMIVNASHVNFKEKADELEQQNRQLTTNVEDLKRAVEQGQTLLAQEQAARRTALAALQTQLGAVTQTLQQRESEVRDYLSQNTLLNQTLLQTQSELKRVTEENQNIRTQIATTLQDRNDLRKRIIETVDQLYSLRSTYTDMQDRVKNLQDQVTILEARNRIATATLAAAGLPENPEDTPPSDVKGVVLAVAGSDLVEISLGTDDGLRVGHQLEVYRGNQYLGRIRIQRVSDDKAVGEVLPGYRRGFIQPSDTVAAKIG